MTKLATVDTQQNIFTVVLRGRVGCLLVVVFRHHDLMLHHDLQGPGQGFKKIFSLYTPSLRGGVFGSVGLFAGFLVLVLARWSAAGYFLADVERFWLVPFCGPVRVF